MYGMKLWRIGTENCISFSIEYKFILYSQTEKESVVTFVVTYHLLHFIVQVVTICDRCPCHSLLKLYLGDYYEVRKRKPYSGQCSMCDFLLGKARADFRSL